MSDDTYSGYAADSREMFVCDNGEQVPLASAGRRLVARIADGLLLGAVFAVGTVAVAMAGSTTLLMAWLVPALIGVIVYEPLMLASSGQTLGKRWLNVRVVNVAHGGYVPAGRAWWRWGMPALLCWVPFIGGILSLIAHVSIVWRPDRRGWHDTAAKTVVIDD